MRQDIDQSGLCLRHGILQLKVRQDVLDFGGPRRFALIDEDAERDGVEDDMGIGERADADPGAGRELHHSWDRGGGGGEGDGGDDQGGDQVL